MTISQWPSVIKVQPVETSEVLNLGSFIPSESTQLQHVLLYLLKVGTLGGSETAQVKIYGNSDLTGVIASSAVVTLSTVTGISAARFLMNVRFDFATSLAMAAGVRYYLGLTLGSYTRNADTFYIAAQMDWPDPFYTPGQGLGYLKPAAKFRIIGKE
jgi:hypothetical protein